MTIHDDRAEIEAALRNIEKQRQDVIEAVRKSFEQEQRRLEQDNRDRPDGGNQNQLGEKIAQLEADKERMIQGEMAILNAKIEPIQEKQKALEAQQHQAEDLNRQDVLRQNEQNFRDQEEARIRKMQEHER
ncbi:MAG: hypothetical protein ABL970_08000 [Nitrospira sp.]